ncbi:putative reverse transcriptase domain-containing protein, partial [Tanacetum coccineum]
DSYVATVSRWRSRVTTRSSSPSNFPIAPITAPPGTRRRAAILIRPGEGIPLGRLYRTYPNGPRRVMTTRKRVRPLPARKIARRRVSPHSSGHHSPFASSSSDHSPIHSSGFDTPNQAHRLARRRVPRLVCPPSSFGDSSSERSLHLSSHSAGPSRKRSRSPIDYVPSSLPVVGSLAPTRADLLPSRKRFRDSYSSKASMEEDIEVGTVEAGVGLELVVGGEIVIRDRDGIDPRDDRDDAEEYDTDTSAGGTIKVGIDPMSAPLVVEESEEPAGGDSSSSSGTRDGNIRVVSNDATQRQLEDGQELASTQRLRMVERIKSLSLENLKVQALLSIEKDRIDSLRLHMTMTITRSGMTPEAIKELVTRRVEEALAAYEATRAANALEAENQSQNGSDNDNGHGGNGNGGNGTGGNGNGGNGNPNEDGRGAKPERYQVKYATCTLLDSALTWWNSYKRTIGTDAAYALSWKELLKLMTKVYCPRNEFQKMETELWNLSVKNNDMATYT